VLVPDDSGRSFGKDLRSISLSEEPVQLLLQQGHVDGFVYDAEDIDQMGDIMVEFLGLTKKLSDPKAKAFLEKAASLPSHIDLESSKKVGIFRLLAAGFDSEIKEGLGVMMELTKAMGKIKYNGNNVPEQETL